MAYREVAMWEILAVLEADQLGHLEAIRGWLEPGPGERRGLQFHEGPGASWTAGSAGRLRHPAPVRGPALRVRRIGRTTVRMAECEPGERVVLDNLKAAIDKADRYAPVSQRVFEG